jgi:hypothetical protein
MARLTIACPRSLARSLVRRGMAPLFWPSARAVSPRRKNRKNLMISVAFDHVCSCLVAAYRWSRHGARCGVMVAGGNCPNFAWKFRVVGHDRAINRSRIYSRSPGLGGELFVHEVFFKAQSLAAGPRYICAAAAMSALPPKADIRRGRRWRLPLLQGKPSSKCDENCTGGCLDCASDASSIEPGSETTEKQNHY